jgi:hypothetical protein
MISRPQKTKKNLQITAQLCRKNSISRNSLFDRIYRTTIFISKKKEKKDLHTHLGNSKIANYVFI